MKRKDAAVYIATMIALFILIECQEMSFLPLSLPKYGPSKHHVRSAKAVKLCDKGLPGNCTTADISYQTLLRSGEGVQCATQWHVASVNSIDTCEEVFGMVKDVDGNPLLAQSYSGMPIQGAFEVSSNPDFSSILKVGDKIYSIVQFEQPKPGTMYMTELKQDSSGKLWPINTQHVDWSDYGGLWIPCAGSVSPWQTHIGGEEYEPDAKYFSEKYYPNDTTICGTSYGVCTSIVCQDEIIQSTDWRSCSELRDSYEFARYMPTADSSMYAGEIKNFTTLRDMFNPYLYGYVFEVDPSKQGKSQMKKWYATGRRSNELAYILPDNRTMYISDDGTNSMMNMFVADRPGDFSSGTLYAAKFNQYSSGAEGGKFTVEWIDLGHANETEIEMAISSIKFSDMFELADPNVTIVDTKLRAVCPDGFKSINQGSAGLECLRLIDGMEKLASRLETRRFAALKGATTEFSKLEGLTYDSKNNRILAAVSDVKKGMEDQKSYGNFDKKYDIGSNNDIRVDYLMCGCVYALELDSQNRAYNMYPFLCGDTKSNVDEKNRCNIENVANPDNVAMMDDFETLLIAEDTKFHENNVLWAYHIPSKKLQRIFSAPYGAEVTSPYFHKIGPYAYIMAVAQHPYEDGHYALSSSSTGKGGYVGYIGPIPLTSAV